MTMAHTKCYPNLRTSGHVTIPEGVDNQFKRNERSQPRLVVLKVD